MKRITVVWTLMMIVIVAGLCLIGYQIKKNNINNVLEKALLTKTKEYLGMYPGLYPDKNYSVIINLSDLIENDFDPKLGTDCDGYVVVKPESKAYSYNAYVKCPNYITENYDENRK